MPSVLVEVGLIVKMRPDSEAQTYRQQMAATLIARGILQYIQHF